MSSRTGQNTIPVAVVSLSCIVREGLTAVLDRHSGFDIIGESTSVPCEEMHPANWGGVAIIDAGGLSHDFACDVIVRSRAAGFRVLVLSPKVDLPDAGSWLLAGALGCFPSDANEEQIIHAVRMIAKGDVYIAEPRSSARSSDGRDARLTKREREVVTMVAMGFTSAQIGSRLCLSTRTVESHRWRIGRKLRLRSRSELVQYALEHHLVRVGREDA